MSQPLKAGYMLQTASVEETETLGEVAGLAAQPGLVFALRGELGAGKTVFVRGLARGLLGKDQAAVTSPTYVLLHVYKNGLLALYHIDAYRMKGGGDEFAASGLAECLADPRGVVCIEWPERVESIVPADRVEIELEHREPTQRRIHVLATGPRSAAVVEAMLKVAGSELQLRERLHMGNPPDFSGLSAPPSLS
ncbi:MAG: tRNA (adenosine(37)-N6)-threonylcarbamoyltransferase complex ATPase subunit type 1 TsaE [Planctomycetes bacterium]|nr:tRNA (adenosine(37)-N6)-threonylcarbamoyltransferase complex ATPase subunit type 1 TsaE [Planctomycetota bacterium]